MAKDDIISIFQDGSHGVSTLLPASDLVMVLVLQMWKCNCTPNFDKISQSAAESLLLPVSENNWPPYWNCTFDFDFDLCFVIGMSFCISLPNFIQIDQRTAELFNVISNFQDTGFCVGNVRPSTKCNCGFIVYRNIAYHSFCRTAAS